MVVSCRNEIQTQVYPMRRLVLFQLCHQVWTKAQNMIPLDVQKYGNGLNIMGHLYNVIV